jgi:hypothetical protein
LPRKITRRPLLAGIPRSALRIPRLDASRHVPSDSIVKEPARAAINAAQLRKKSQINWVFPPLSVTATVNNTKHGTPNPYFVKSLANFFGAGKAIVRVPKRG